MHILLIPAIILALIGIHLALVWYQKHTQFPGPGATEKNVVGVRILRCSPSRVDPSSPSPPPSWR